MPIAREHLVSADQPGCYHLISRSVRRAFLCGDRAEHRRAWVSERIQAAAAAFAVFSTNSRRFVPGPSLATATEITAQTTDEDFRGRPAHRCWQVTPA